MLLPVLLRLARAPLAQLDVAEDGSGSVARESGYVLVPVEGQNTAWLDLPVPVLLLLLLPQPFLQSSSRSSRASGVAAVPWSAWFPIRLDDGATAPCAKVGWSCEKSLRG